MTATQMRWAASHDWYRGASLEDGRYTVFVVDAANNIEVTFTNFTFLRIWAGY